MQNWYRNMTGMGNPIVVGSLTSVWNPNAVGKPIGVQSTRVNMEKRHQQMVSLGTGVSVPLHHLAHVGEAAPLAGPVPKLSWR